MSRRLLLPAFFCAITLSSFQNCAQNGFLTSSEETFSLSENSSTSDTVHPSEPLPKFDSFQEPLINKLYVGEILRSIFKSHDGGAESLINSWIDSRGSSFGIGCDVYSSLASTNCGGDVSNSNVLTRTNPTVMRELYRLKICNELIGAGGAPTAALEKVGLTPAAAVVNAENVSKVYSLFYRTQDPDEFEIATFMDLDKTLQTSGVNQTERWRAILITICESTGWQQF